MRKKQNFGRNISKKFIYFTFCVYFIDNNPIQLTKLLASKGWNIEDRRDIFNFIVRAVNLKDAALRQKFVKEINDFQRSENMRTLSFVEEYFRDKGLAEGLTTGLERARREEKFETARRLREMGMKDNDIHRATNLSFEDIRTL